MSSELGFGGRKEEAIERQATVRWPGGIVLMCLGGDNTSQTCCNWASL
jgi:hypothetical protein